MIGGIFKFILVVIGCIILVPLLTFLVGMLGPFISIVADFVQSHSTVIKASIAIAAIVLLVYVIFKDI